MPTIEVNAGTYERLSRQAAARHTTVDDLVAPALDQMALGQSRTQAPGGTGAASTPTRNLSAEEFTRLLDSMAIELADPPDPAITYTREDIYFDHD